MIKTKQKIIKSDLVKSKLLWEGDFVEVKLELYFLDILRIMSICKNAGNDYYYNQLRWFVERVIRYDKDITHIDYNRRLPRIYLKEKKKWELEEMLREEF